MDDIRKLVTRFYPEEVRKEKVGLFTKLEDQVAKHCGGLALMLVNRFHQVILRSNGEVREDDFVLQTEYFLGVLSGKKLVCDLDAPNPNLKLPTEKYAQFKPRWAEAKIIEGNMGGEIYDDNLLLLGEFLSHPIRGRFEDITGERRKTSIPMIQLFVGTEEIATSVKENSILHLVFKRLREALGLEENYASCVI